MTRECSVTVFATDHEQVVFCQDRASGLRAIIAIYSTALGPALGGTRFYPYATEDDALADVLNLSRGMAYKNALAGLDLGGGKAVIWGDPTTDKTEALLRAYGRFVESLGGRYYTACDVGTYVQDMDVVARETRFVTGRSRSRRRRRRLVGAHRLGRLPGHAGVPPSGSGAPPSLAGRRVGIAGRRQGRPAPGRPPGRRRRRGRGDRRLRRRGRRGDRGSTRRSAPVADADALVRTPTRRLRAVRARRGAVRRPSSTCCSAQVVCGAANNQLAHPGVEKMLADRGVLYAPDYVVNSGGVIQVADEYRGYVAGAGPDQGDGDLRHHPAASSPWPPRRASHLRSRPIGWPSGGWPRSAGCAGSWSRAGTVDPAPVVEPKANVPVGRRAGCGRRAAVVPLSG